MRYPAVAGAFYERSRDALLRQIRECYTHPLGTASIDVGLYDAVSKPPLEDDILAHRDEHSIEVQLPFLQALADPVRFVPVCMAFQEYDLASEVGGLVADAVKGKSVMMIASSDFTHAGVQYNQMPPRGTTAPAF